jgi:hypothetical protein
MIHAKLRLYVGLESELSNPIANSELTDLDYIQKCPKTPLNAPFRQLLLRVQVYYSLRFEFANNFLQKLN